MFSIFLSSFYGKCKKLDVLCVKLKDENLLPLSPKRITHMLISHKPHKAVSAASIRIKPPHIFTSSFSC